MKVYFVGAGPGDMDLMTVKSRRLLETCRCCIYAGSLVSGDVLSLIPAAAKKHDSAEMDLEQIIAAIKAAHGEGMDVVRLHSGDPSIYGAIREQMDELDNLGISYEVVPGVSSFQAAAAALNLELTIPEKAQTVILTRAAGRTPVPPEQDLEQLAKAKATMCIFLSVQLIGEVVKKLSPEYGGECPVAVVFHASWPDQKIVRGTLVDIAERVKSEGINRTALIVVGEALLRRQPQSKLYDKDFKHGYRK
ncbi:MAG: precorrin-4 C(11)-methyltransferase [Nitrospinae bacterium]|nr:precorrin-4 C(11)-methyltransferase [Nitrospinota bacterium]